MKTPTVIIHSSDPAPAMEIVQTAHPDLEIHGCDSFAGLPAKIEETGAEVVYSIRFDTVTPYPRASVLENPQVQWLSVGGSGIDHLKGWDPASVTVTNAAGGAAGMMAEYAIGTILSFSLGLRGFHRAQQARAWDLRAKVTPIEGSTLLIIGLGHTGRATAQRAKAMGMRVLGLRARPKDTPHVDEVHGVEALHTLLARADYVLLSVPLTDETRGLMDAAAFAAMKPGAILVDVSRGKVCDEAALLSALETGPMAGAALDVFSTEPLPADSPFWGMENVILTPHCSGVYDAWYQRSAQMFAQNLTRYRKGEVLVNIVDPVRGY